MDTPTAIQTLQVLQQNEQAKITIATANVTAIQIALDQLQGVLTTQLTALTTANETINTLNAEIVAPTSVTTSPTIL